MSCMTAATTWWQLKIRNGLANEHDKDSFPEQFPWPIYLKATASAALRLQVVVWCTNSIISIHASKFLILSNQCLEVLFWNSKIFQFVFHFALNGFPGAQQLADAHGGNSCPWQRLWVCFLDSLPEYLPPCRAPTRFLQRFSQGLGKTPTGPLRGPCGAPKWLSHSICMFQKCLHLASGRHMAFTFQHQKHRLHLSPCLNSSLWRS